MAASESPAFRDILTTAVRYWELRRLVYNAALAAVVIACFVAEWPDAKQALHFDSMLALFILAVLANVAYCAAYVPDIALQYSSLRETWLRCRFLLLIVGILFAGAVTYFFALGIVNPWVD